VKGVWRHERFRPALVTIGAQLLNGTGLRDRPCIPPVWVGALALSERQPLFDDSKLYEVAPISLHLSNRLCLKLMVALLESYPSFLLSSRSSISDDSEESKPSLEPLGNGRLVGIRNLVLMKDLCSSLFIFETAQGVEVYLF
jgi:hypothetical protein